MRDPILEAIDNTRKALAQYANSHWIIGFAGGKDSTALLKIFATAARYRAALPKCIDVIYCDTGVENPLLDTYVKELLVRLDSEFVETNSIFKTKILKAPIENRFFVKIIGRGYPPPTNTFRWCTNNLRIRPVSSFIRATAASEDAIVSLGIRRGESAQRDRSVMRAGGKVWQQQIEGGRKYRLFLPIIEFGVPEVWDSLFALPRPAAISAATIEELYRGASGGECPIIKEPKAAPCASGRFGCWTCTVVRRDRSAESLIRTGHTELLPYVEFRNWLAQIRNDVGRRWPQRRSGAAGPGPFRLAAREEILDRLLSLEKQVGKTLLPLEELDEIRRLWGLDSEIETRLGRPL